MDEEQALFLEYGIAAGGTIVFTIAVGLYFLQEQQKKTVEFESFDSSR
jgi:ethanolamine transporter EutH